MGHESDRLLGPSFREISIRGLGFGTAAKYREEQWREAILVYLFSVWSGKTRERRPEISFGAATLVLNPDSGTYSMYGFGADEASIICQPEETLAISCDQREVELGLVRFVKNDRIKKLMIREREGEKFLVLWKGERRGQYGSHTENLTIS